MTQRRASRFTKCALLLCLLGSAGGRADDAKVELRIEIRQNMEMILYSIFGEPPQYAVWLEDVETGKARTVSVTRRSATGDWVGKLGVPVALPRWFEVYRKETGHKGLPRPATAMPDAVTRATPQTGAFEITATVERGSRWICWIEVNIAADFNETYPPLDETAGWTDSYFNGQPALLFRAEIDARPGLKPAPELYGKSILGADGSAAVERDTSGITTASEIFSSIRLEVTDAPK